MATESEQNSSSPIKLLNDFARRNKILYDFQLENESGPAHSKIFTIRLRFGEKEYRGIDRSIKLAQRAAAKLAVEDQKELFNEISTKKDQTKPITTTSPTVVLNTWAAQNHIVTRYVLIHEEFLPRINDEKYPKKLFIFRLFIGDDLFFDGQGFSQSHARYHCATLALNYLRTNSFYTKIDSNSVDNVGKSPISLMYERARQLGLTVQIENPTTTSVVYRVGENYTSSATGSTKQMAKRVAAEKLLQLLPSSTIETKTSKRTKTNRKFVEQRGSLDYSRSEEINPISRVYQIGQARNVRVEFRQIKEENSTRKTFHFVVEFGDEHRCDGFGSSKQNAKRVAAENLLVQLNPKEPTKSLLKRDETTTNEKKHVHFLLDETTKDENHSKSFSIKQQLIKSCEKYRIRIEFEDEQKTNDDEQMKTILSLFLDQRLLAKFRGQGPTLKRAQENASAAAWKNLRDLFNGSISVEK